MRRQHHPEMAKRADGRWEIHCVQCEENTVESVPLGIGAPITAEPEARFILENHRRARGRRGAPQPSLPEPTRR
jgi:hypothetical protein